MTRPLRNAVGALCAIVLLSGLTAALAESFPSAWSHWRYSRAIRFGSYAGPVGVFLSAEVLARTENRLADLRVLDDLGREVPHVVASEQGQSTSESLPARLRENSFVPGRYTQVLLDLDKNSRFHNTVRVLTPEPDFMDWVEVAASDDTRQWRIAKPRAPISRFQRENIEGNQTTHYSDNNARYLRLSIFDTERQFNVTGAEVLISTTREPRLAPIPARLERDPGAGTGVSQWNGDLGSTQIPVAEAAFVVEQPEFYRGIRVRASEDEAVKKPSEFQSCKKCCMP